MSKVNSILISFSALMTLFVIHVLAFDLQHIVCFLCNFDDIIVSVLG